MSKLNFERCETCGAHLDDDDSDSDVLVFTCGLTYVGRRDADGELHWEIENECPHDLEVVKEQRNRIAELEAQLVAEKQEAAKHLVLLKRVSSLLNKPYEHFHADYVCIAKEVDAFITAGLLPADAAQDVTDNA